MNLYEIMGLVHVGAMAVALISAAIILILKKEKVISFDKVNSLLFVLAVLDMAISIMYFIIDYYSEITGTLNCSVAVRVADAWITVSMVFLWFFLLKNIIFENKTSSIWYVVKILYILLLITNLINYGFIMDENYAVQGETLKQTAAFLELSDTLITVTVAAIIIIMLIRANKTLNTVKYKFEFAIIGTLVIITDYLQSAKIGIKFITGAVILHDYSPDAINITPIIRLLFAVILLWYVVKHCFLEQYQKPPETVISTDKQIREEYMLDLLTARAQLTERESVIMKLLYAGSTYQDIADFLYISKNTVKHHITSLYKKLDVASKMEMINLIRTMDEK